MKKILIPLLLLIALQIFSQKQETDYKFGLVTPEEKSMKFYDKDSTANAVVLYEQGFTKFIYKGGGYKLKTTIYKKIKIFNKDGNNHATITIPLYHNDNKKEKLKKIKATTINNDDITPLDHKNIYTTRISDRWSEVKFTMPNIKAGSIIEFEYTTESPFIYNFKGWYFQSSIPKIKSVFKAKIAGNFYYNRHLKGYLKLSKNKAEIKKKCFRISGIGSSDCEILTYEMINVPIFIEEDFMTSRENFISRIAFELSEYRSFDFINSKKYTKTWETVDEEFKIDDNIGGQLERISFFENIIPNEIKEESNDLEKAKKAYYFIQNHYSWNGDYKLFSDINLKSVFKKRVGTVGGINISLINSLNAIDIDAKLVLLSTRNNGTPTKTHPIISEFNYIVAKVVIDGITYFLDATDKSLPFGVLPYRCLNKDARVMDFKNGSYWEEIIPINDSKKEVVMILELNPEGNFEGNIRVTNTGYNAINTREKLQDLSEEKYLTNFEDASEGLEIKSYINKYLEEIEVPLIEEFKITFENDLSVGDKIYLNPFFIDKIEENPFKLDSREYPVDFGYSRKVDFLLTLYLPENYEIESIPQNKTVTLPNNGGDYNYTIVYINNKIEITFNYSLNKYYFYNNEYENLKELFKQMIISQTEPIILKNKL
ncbi:DUF3857 domain-containing protein [Urechidicola croceus]|uniref:DUF3857 domain-containing protein n=1 Tax=Urechidicola croceus TaxID=1850246 RepID=A0A1D8P503_9FLAO|nr:DUF3857 domain-containing protein [Urechidicola croceus]AOW19669.1 hypothetical protein LPB138_02780 [Urechidicola croceus]